MPGQRREPPIVVRRDGAIAWVVLNRPDVLNALSFEMQEALPTLMEGLSRDKEVRVLVLTGAGDQAFCAGADVSEFKEKRATPERALRHLQLVQAAFTAVFDCPKVVIAMINGYAVGNGYMLAMFCDLRTAADTARIGITSSRLGSGGGSGSSGESRVRGALAPVLDSGRNQDGLDPSAMLVELAGPANAKHVLLSGRLFPAAKALSMGLVDEIVPAARLESCTRELAEEIAANEPQAVMRSKASINTLLKSRIGW